MVGLFASAVSSLIGGGVPSLSSPLSSTATAQKEAKSSAADVSGATSVTADISGTKNISFGGASTNWMIILGVVAVIFFAMRR